MKPTRLVAYAGALVLAWVVVFAGEYSTFDWLQLRRQVAEERRALQDLRVALDSLSRLAHDLETNRAAQERAARERFGMIRNGELLYRLVPPGGAAQVPR